MADVPFPRVAPVDFSWLGELPQRFEEAQTRAQLKQTLGGLDLEGDADTLERAGRQLLRNPNTLMQGMKLMELGRARKDMELRRKAAERAQDVLLETERGGGATRADGGPIFDKLVERGFHPVHAAGIAGNFGGESAFDPGAQERAPQAGRGGFGLAQWTGPRRERLESFAKSRGKPVSDVDTQLDFLQSELEGPEAGAGAALRRTRTPASAARVFEAEFERPGIPSTGRRVAEASRLFAQGNAREELRLRQLKLQLLNPDLDANSKKATELELQDLQKRRADRENDFRKSVLDRERDVEKDLLDRGAAAEKESTQAAYADYKEAVKRSPAISAQRHTLERMDQILNDPRTIVGPGSESAAKIGGFGLTLARAAGVATDDPKVVDKWKNLDKLRDAVSLHNEFGALSNRNVLGLLGGSLGNQVSNTDRDYMRDSAAGPQYTVEGNRAIIFQQRRLVDRMQEAQNAHDAYMAQPGAKNPAIANKLVRDIMEKPLFTPEERAKMDAALGRNRPTPEAAPAAPRREILKEDEGRAVTGPGGKRYIIRNGIPVEVGKEEL